MLYSYAFYSKKHNRSYMTTLLLILLMFIVHVALLLETENIWLLCGVLVYLPLYLIWSRVSSLRSRIPD